MFVLTLDKGVPYQQQIASRKIAVLIVRARSNRIDDLLPLLTECLAALDSWFGGGRRVVQGEGGHKDFPYWGDGPRCYVA